MCISNIGNRRPYGASTMALNKAAAAQQAQPSSLLSTLNIKQLQQQATQQSQQPEQRIASPKASSKSPKSRNVHIIVQHHYHDHANDNPADYQEEHPARGGVTTPFPLKLHEMLENIAADGYDDVISWQPHGRCFVVHKPKEFVELLPRYFKLSKLASFQRQLNLYGFQRLTRGRDRGGYYHELFLRDRVFLAHNIQRIKVKGTGVRARSNPDQEPDFWGMSWVEGTSRATIQATHQVQTQPQAQLQLQLPLPQVNLSAPKQLDDDIVCAFGNKTFHYLDPFVPNEAVPSWAETASNDVLPSEAESFFEDFDFPSQIGVEIEDDAVFGSMLEQMIA